MIHTGYEISILNGKFAQNNLVAVVIKIDCPDESVMTML